MTIRPTNEADLAALKTVIDQTELFPSDLLPELIAPFLADPSNGDLWLTAEIDGIAQGLCYAVPEPMTVGTWNMRALAVAPSQQGSGIGSRLVSALEARLRESGQHVLLVDTSGTDAFAQTRAFYRRNGYGQEARIRDFWAPGDDKVVFWKAL